MKIQAQKLTQEPNRYVNPNTEHEAKLPNNQQPKRYLVQTTLSQEHSSPNKFKTLQIAKLSFTTHKTTCQLGFWFDLFTYLQVFSEHLVQLSAKNTAKRTSLSKQHVKLSENSNIRTYATTGIQIDATSLQKSHSW